MATPADLPIWNYGNVMTKFVPAAHGRVGMKLGRLVADQSRLGRYPSRFDSGPLASESGEVMNYRGSHEAFVLGFPRSGLQVRQD